MNTVSPAGDGTDAESRPIWDYSSLSRALTITDAWVDIVIVVGFTLYLLNVWEPRVWALVRSVVGGLPGSALTSAVTATLSVGLAALMVRSRGISARTIGIDARGIGGQIARGVILAPVAYGLLWLFALGAETWLEFGGSDAGEVTATPPGVRQGLLEPAALACFRIATAVTEALLYLGILLPRVYRVTRSWLLALLAPCPLSLLWYSGVLSDQLSGLILLLALAGAYAWTRSLIVVICAHLVLLILSFVLET